MWKSGRGGASFDSSNVVLSGSSPLTSSLILVSGDGQCVRPASGRTLECPDFSRDDLFAQEEIDCDGFDSSPCGSGNAMMMPLILRPNGWLKLQR